MTRVITYVDGQNLYYGLRAKDGRRYHWLDLVALATSLLPQGHQLVELQYFTARVGRTPTRRGRDVHDRGRKDPGGPVP